MSASKEASFGVNASTWNLASSKELISREISTPILLATLDEISDSFANPMFKHCELARNLLLQMMLYYDADYRRKMSVVPRKILNSRIIKTVLTGDYSHMSNTKLDRSLVWQICSKVNDILIASLDLELQIAKAKSKKVRRHYLLQRRNLSLQVGCAEELLAPVARWCKSYLEMYNKFYEMIVTKYFKLSYHKAKRAAYFTRMTIDKNDLFKNYVMASMFAINKCDASRGTLTNVVEQQYTSMKNNPMFEHQYNVSFTIKPNLRREMERKGTPLTNFIGNMPQADTIVDPEKDLWGEHIEITKETPLIKAIRYVKDADLALLLLRVPIVLTKAELALQLGR